MVASVEKFIMNIGHAYVFLGKELEEAIFETGYV